MANTEISLDDLHASIEKSVKEQFTGLKLVQFYRGDEKEERGALTPEQLPACLLELTEMEPAPDEDPGTEQLAVNARFEAQLIIGFRTPRAKLEIRKLAAAFAVFLRMKRWPHQTLENKTLPTGPAIVVNLVPDDFSPELDRFEVWRVEWTQLIHLGSSIWNDEGLSPGTPLYSWLPEIGFGHEDDYLDLPEIPELFKIATSEGLGVAHQTADALHTFIHKDLPRK